MDINKNKVNKIPNVFDKFIGKTNTYIPAMHKNAVDTFEITSKNISFKGNTVTKEDVLSKLNSVDIPDEVKVKISKNLETLGEVTLANKFLSDSRLYGNALFQHKVASFLSKYDKEEAIKAKLDIMDKYLSDDNLEKSKNAQSIVKTALIFVKNGSGAKVVSKILSDPRLYDNPSIEDNYCSICSWSNQEDVAQVKLDIIDKYLSTPELYENEDIQNIIGKIIQKANGVWACKIALRFLSSPELYQNKGLLKNIPNIVSAAGSEGKADVINGIFSTPALYENEALQENIESILFNVVSPDDLTYSSKLMDFIQNGDISPQIAVNLVKNSEKVRYKQVRKLRETISPELFSKIAASQHDLVIASTLLPLYEKNQISEISHTQTRQIIRALIQNNFDMFVVSDELRKFFPLIPRNREEYCSLLPELVKSLGIETKPLSETKISEFESDLQGLSTNIGNLSEEEFDNLTVSLSYDKNDFIKDTLALVQDLPKEEKQKVYDYYGFELKHNKHNPTGFSLSGYPVNINNTEKLAQISNDKTKEAIAALRPNVVRFSEQNQVHSNNKDIEALLNGVLDALPELNTTINRPQHGKHQYDVFKHSLKVMQKIVQNPKFESLSESDKKVILLASLLHDITKAEGKPDPTHDSECSFDAFFIAKKFNLPQQEQTKLYTLIDTHEWLKYVNEKDISPEEQTQRMQSVAFDLQNGNIFELSKIFTEADIKAISKNDGLYDVFGPALESLSKPIEEYVNELQKTKPILPITKLPKVSEIESRITTVNSDCSTNIKGVYQKDGLLVIKYNEVENWEELGFAKGNVSHGIQITNPIDGNVINTGTIKFIAHGFDEANQLSNFSVFNMPDSDALLSVSYMERPESKYRLFRTQGVLLDVESNNIYGGGESDSGSGFKKTISDFKLNYIFGGERENDRSFVSTLIKENLGLTDDEYIKFVNANENKSMNEIEPVEIREKLIKCFSLINSNIRLGDREYNEMYVSNPVVQGVYAYSAENNVGDVSSFIDLQPEFLKDYAKQNDLPFFVFGD